LSTIWHRFSSIQAISIALITILTLYQNKNISKIKILAKGIKIKILAKDKECSILSPCKMLLTSLSKHSVQISRGKVTVP
jgi:hypothetical protein